MKNWLGYLLFASLLSFSLISCGDDEDEMMPEVTKNIIEIAQENGFTSLASALTRAGLVDDLQATGPFTVFAPTNDAFDNLLAAVGQTSIEDIPINVLQEILLYHVLSGNIMSAEISNGDVPTLEGSNITLNTNGGITVNGTNVVSPFDVEASNGIIHTVDAVLVPATIGKFVNTVLEPAFFNDNFTTLIEAAAKANVVDVLLNTPNLTIFAPDNSAFETSGIVPANLDSETLATVLTYHVVGSKVLSSEIPREASTVNGEALFFSLIPEGNFINGNIEIKTVDIESGTGVVHVIDQVVLPPTGNIVETAVSLTSTGEFTSLVAALQRTADEGSPEQNLLTVLSSDGPFTVFAPTNAAFQALLDSNEDWNSLSDIPLGLLIEVLTYHVIPARAYDKDLAGAIDSDSQLPTAQGSNITVDLSNLTINSNSKIIGTNNNTTNGVIHVIDSVLLP